MNWQEYKQQQKTTQLGDAFISYREYGNKENECLICLHGIPTWGYIYHDLAEKLSEDYYVLVPDLLGYGFSMKTDNFDRAIDKQVAYLLQWMKELDIDSAAFVAHDIGGGVALRMAVSHQEKVSKLCLMNSICYDSWPVELILQLGHPSIKKFSPKLVNTFLNQAIKKGFHHSPSKELREGMLAPWSSEEGQISLIRNASSLNTNHTTEITALLPQISIPTLLLWGKEDVFQNISYARRLNEDIPHSKLVEVQKARHWVMLDQPDIVFENIRDFLSQNESIYSSNINDEINNSLPF